MNQAFDLESRLIQFAVQTINLAEKLPDTVSGKYLQGQIIRSGAAPALNYGEAQAAESRADFIHKLKISLKELKETRVCLRIIELKGFFPVDKLEALQNECEQLVAIIGKSISTSKSRLKSS